MRDAHILPTLENLAPGDHLCCLYETEEEHWRVLRAFLGQGLERSEKLLCIVDEHSDKKAINYLWQDGFSVRDSVDSQQLSILTSHDAYLRDGAFDPDEMVALLRDEMERGLAEGYAALRVAGEMSWALRGLPGSQRLIEYEAKLNEFLPGSKCLAICQYDRRRFDPSTILDVLATHPIVVVGTEVYNNHYYLPPSGFLGPNRSAATLASRLEDLAGRKRCERAVREGRERADNIMETMRDPFMVLDAGLRVVSANSSFFRTFEVKPSQIQGQLIYDVADRQWDIPRLRELLGQVLPRKSSVDDFELEHDFSHVGRRTMLLSARRMYSETNDAQMVLLSIKDITKRRLTELELERHREHLEELVEQRTGLLKRVNEKLQGEIAKRKRVEEELRRSERELAIKNKISGTFLTKRDGEVYKEVLEVVLDAMESKHGVFGYIAEDGSLVCPSMTGQVWEECNVAGKDIVFPRQNWGNTIWAGALLGKKTLYSNEPFSVPQGHIAIHRSMATPVIHRRKVIGLLHVGNKATDYDEEDRKLLEALAKHVAPMLRAQLERDKEERERRRAEDALRRSEASLSDAQRIAHLGNWDWSIDTNELRWSDEVYRIFGLIPQEFGATYDAFLSSVHSDDREMVKRAVDRALREQEPYDIEHRIVRRDGSERIVHEQAGVVHDDSGRPIRMLGTVHDITERKRAEKALREYSERLEEMVEQRTKELREAQEQLLRSEKLAVLGQLAGGVGHELRNPLGAIKNAAYFLKLTLENPEREIGETLEILENEVEASERIISSLLDFARPKPPNRRKVDINELIEQTLRRIGVRDNIKVVTELCDGPPIMLADPDQLSQVFGNIIVNAVQAMPEGGRLTVRSEVRSADCLAISFEDTGVGIPQENLQKIFEPLFTTKAKGIGLGLAVINGLVEGHGGSIDVKSVVGKGSTFTVKLPTSGRQVNQHGEESQHTDSG